MGGLQGLVIAFGEALDLDEVACGQQFQMLVDDQQGELILRAGRQRLKPVSYTHLTPPTSDLV